MPKITTVIAAGGLGTRLVGYKGNDSTKMLLKVNNLSMISHQLNQLIGWGLDDFVIVTNPIFDNLIKEDVLSNFSKVKYTICASTRISSELHTHCNNPSKLYQQII